MPNQTPLRPIVQKMFDSVADLVDSVCIGAVDRSTLSTDELREYISDVTLAADLLRTVSDQLDTDVNVARPAGRMESPA